MKKDTILKCAAALLLALLLPLQAVSQTDRRGDCDYDGRFDVGDVTALINYILTDQWNDTPEALTRTVSVNGVDYVMVHVEGGTYTLGEATYTVQGFWIGQTEVTSGLWKAVTGSSTIPVNKPICDVTLIQCNDFISQLNELTGLPFRLPRLTEWRFAALGGNKSLGYRYPGSDNHKKVACSKDITNGINPVASYKCNELGLYDMGGNVAEFCTSGDKYYACGGSYFDPGENCIAGRAVLVGNTGIHYGFYGLRVLLPENALSLEE